ncbi:hypothetical protein JCM31826_12840 [Thermaurantimonas aggregans]|uniref:Uncharacterized protein n=1 Tax=Thermaurantimonas aggregans TaxID=2173829 RepID=A0A401XLB7_9FLAO|nr:hypothetical protein JCM31826_12840 [Thermaurantimonas aggregans]
MSKSRGLKGPENRKCTSALVKNEVFRFTARVRMKIKTADIIKPIKAAKNTCILSCSSIEGREKSST